LYLQEEEEVRIVALREEEKQKSQKIKEMSREMSSLSDTIRTIEEELGPKSITFLQVRTTVLYREHSSPGLCYK
jgi:alkyl hydroperoxide reductase subunit AhpF